MAAEVRGEPMRAKFRNGWDNPQPLTPNELNSINYEMQDVNRTFRRSHAVVVQIEGSSYRLRQHADLVPEHIRSKALIQPPPVTPPPRRRGRPPKNGAAHHAAG